MKRFGWMIAAALVFFGAAAVIDGRQHEPSDNCTAALMVQEQQALQNMNNSAPVPPGASWPTRTLDILHDTLYDPNNPATLNALYWEVQYETVIPAEIGTTAQGCPAGGNP